MAKLPGGAGVEEKGGKRGLGVRQEGKTLRGQEQRRARVSGGTWGWLAGGTQSLECAEAGQWGE